MANNVDFKGFWAWLVKLAAPMLTDERVLAAASWLVLELIKRAVQEPERRKKIIEMALDFTDQIRDFIETVEAGNIPAALLKR